MPKVLHVGCGRATLARMPRFFQDGSWQEIRVDIDPAVRPDILATMTDLGAVGTASVQAVFSSHSIEHLFPHEVPLALAEFRRVLDAEGFALITCPDLQSVAQLIADDKLMDPAYQSRMGPIAPLDILFGHRDSIARGNHFMAHRGGFTMRSLTHAVKDAGFAQVFTRRRPPHFDLWSIGLVTPLGDEARERRGDELFP